jgi:predicted homoserine dehydrogenase-like protein
MITKKLLRRHAAGNPIRVGWVGAGRMNTGAICQAALMKGLVNAVICDINPPAAIRAYEINGRKREELVVSDQLGELNDAIARGKPAVTSDALLLPQLNLDCIVEGTGSPDLGARVAWHCIQNKRHIVMLNVETDVVVGPILHRLAQSAGVVYTVSSGDEPGLITELVDRWGGLGFEIAAVGKTPAILGSMDRYCNPDTVAEDARARKINPNFLVTFRDASKTAIEMACISNATGLVPDIRGMHGPTAGVEDMAKLFKTKSEGGLLNRLSVVDFARPLKKADGTIDYVNSVTPGVFVVVRTTHPQIKEDLRYFDVTGDGDYFTFYTPYHLVTQEIPLSIVWAVEDREPTVVAERGLLSEVIAAAKTDLKAGTIMDGAGGFTVYALIELAAVAKRERLVPYELLKGARLRQDVKRDEVITVDMVELKTDTTIYHLRQLQDQLMGVTEVR